jgi:hypothetical protein
MPLALCSRRIQHQRLGIDRISRRRPSQHALRAGGVVVLEEGATVQRQHLAARVGIRRRARQRLERSGERVAIVARARRVQPDTPERRVEREIVRRPLEGVAQGEHRELVAVSAGVRHAQGHLSLGMRPIQPRQQLELHELVRAAIERCVQLGQLFADGNGRRFDGNRLFERRQRISRPPFLAQAEPEHVVGARDLVVEAKRLGGAAHGGVEVAVVVARKRQLEDHARQAVVDAGAALERLGRAVVAMQLVEHVAQFLERPGRTGIQRRRGAKVPRRQVEVAAIAAPLVGFAAPEVGEHRVRAQLDGAAVGLDGGEGLVVAEGGVASCDAGLVRPLAGSGLVDHGAADGQGEECGDQERARHSALS